MSDKITFDELVGEIARKSDNSKSITRDFIKDIVAQIHDGLLTDGSVNIAQLGKFERQHVDEREGYNPQKDESMIIPAHHKIVFKPYKMVRETVNAPFAHMEPQLIGEGSEAPSAGSEALPPNVHRLSGRRQTDQWAGKRSRNRPDRGPLGHLSRWIGAGLAFTAAAVGAWFLLTKDDE